MEFTEDQKAQVRSIRKGLRVSKVVATRAVKTKHGDFFVGMSAAWDSTQEDAGGLGADLIDALEDDEHNSAIIDRGMTLKQAEVASLLLGMHVDVQAITHALCGGAITEEEHTRAVRSIRRNYILQTTKVIPPKETTASESSDG